MTVFLVSLMGMPPTIGFYAKYYVIVAAIEIADLLWLALADRRPLGRERLLLPAGGGGDVLQRAGARAATGHRPGCSTSASAPWWSPRCWAASSSPARSSSWPTAGTAR